MRVLYVDDTADTCVLVAASIQMRHLEGVDLDTAIGGKAGFDAFFDARAAGKPYDAVLIDIAMPGIDGYTLARLIRVLEMGRQVKPAKLGFITNHGRDIISNYEIETNKIDFCWHRRDCLPDLVDHICQWLTGNDRCEMPEAPAD